MTYRPGRDDWFRRLRQQEAGKPQKPLGGKAYGFSVEVAAGDDQARFGQHQGVVGGGVGFDL